MCIVFDLGQSRAYHTYPVGSYVAQGFRPGTRWNTIMKKVDREESFINIYQAEKDPQVHIATTATGYVSHA